MNSGCDVFVCTHNRPKELLGVIKSLKEARGNFNIFVIDSSDNPLKKQQTIGCKYLYKKGMKPLSEKRNLAIKISKAKYIAFTDDDCIVDKNWVVELLGGFQESGKIACCTGLTLPYKNYINSEYEKRYSFSKIGKEKKLIKKKLFVNLWRLGHGNNMILRRDIFSKIGLYDVNLGVGTQGLAGEDTDMFYRILKAGYYLFYDPGAIVYHKHLIKDSEIEKTAYRNGFGTRKVLLKNMDFNCLVLYILIFLKYSLRFIIKPNKVEKGTLKGLLGMQK